MADIAERMKSLRGVARQMRHPPQRRRWTSSGRFQTRLAVAPAVWLVQSGGVRADHDHAGRAVRDNSGDREWMAAPSETFMERAADIRASIARFERIREKCARESRNLEK